MEKELNKTNYFSHESDLAYMSYSQFKDFCECEAKAMAIIKGEYEKPTSTALLQGSYVDAYFSGEMEEFKANNPSIFKKDGSLKSDFEICDKVIETIEHDEEFVNEFYKGDTQQILTGEIAGVPFKGKIDMLYPDKIVDMKCMASIDPVWDEEEHRKKPFYSFYRYDIQAAIYQELVFQSTGLKLPYYLAVVTKEKTPKKVALLFDQSVLDKALEEVKAKAPRFQAIKEGKENPVECGKCDYYHANHKFTIFDIKEITLEDM